MKANKDYFGRQNGRGGSERGIIGRKRGLIKSSLDSLIFWVVPADEAGLA